MVSKASELLPDPLTPLTTVSALCGISTSMPLRLWVRAPRRMMWSCIRFSQLRLAAQDLQQQQACADHHAAIGYVEVGPMIVIDVHLEKIGYPGKAHAVVHVAHRSAE